MWRCLLSLVVAIAVLTTETCAAKPPELMTQDELDAEIKSLEQTVEALANQLMQQQTFVEEKIRSEAMSGVHTLRHKHQGTKPYYGDNHISNGALGNYDPYYHERSLGYDRFTAVMNGVEFKINAGGFRLRSPSHKNHNFHATEDIPFPDVPPEVTNKPTITEQITEMQEWFKAFNEQNYTVRDYRKYFKPNLCYMEGAWTVNRGTKSLPADNERHWTDATYWFKLLQKVRFTAYGGSHSNSENFAHLPITLYNMTAGGIPQFARWNYRILCHAISKDVPTQYFELQEDLASRLAHGHKWDSEDRQRTARFKINEFGTDRYTPYNFLDELMSEIPGKDNYGANLTDDSFGLMNYDAKTPAEENVLNTAMYHRWFKLGVKGAMGLSINHRGYHDENMWVAQTTQENIMPLSIKHCIKGECSWATKRVSYALPLEIMYATPLSKWNPYGIKRQADNIVGANGRNGRPDAAHAFNGTSEKYDYRTPVEFYKNVNKFGALDPKGDVKMVYRTGLPFATPNIAGVGPVRLRYPIFSVHSEGSTQGQELMALRQMVMKMGRYQYLYEEKPSNQPLTPNEDRTFIVRASYKNPPGLHGHSFTITSDEYSSLMQGKPLNVTTSFNLGHQHQLRIIYNLKRFVYIFCDDKPIYQPCWDGHARVVTLART